VAGWLTVAILVYGLVLFRRGGGGTAIGQLEASNRILEASVKSLKEQAERDQRQIAQLQASRDFGSAMRPVVDMIARHDEAEREQFTAIMGVLERIAHKLDGTVVTSERAIPE